jgi:EAL domain-containing protein (putative c-di-GMP-specific phosphodiesterase class I)
MAHSLHLNLIAEGVDSAEHVSFLTAHGCLAAQGFYYSQAVPAESLSVLLDQTSLTPTADGNANPATRRSLSK